MLKLSRVMAVRVRISIVGDCTANCQCAATSAGISQANAEVGNYVEAQYRRRYVRRYYAPRPYAVPPPYPYYSYGYPGYYGYPGPFVRFGPFGFGLGW